MVTRLIFVALLLCVTSAHAQDSFTPDNSFASRLKQVEARCAQLESRFDWWYGAPRSADRRDYLTVFIYSSTTCQMALQLIKELQAKLPAALSEERQQPLPQPIKKIPVRRPLGADKQTPRKVHGKKR